MGRHRVFRQLARERTDSLGAKTTLHGLVSLVRGHCEISWPEAELLGGTLYDFFVGSSSERSEGQIRYGAGWTPHQCSRRTPPLSEPLPVRLTVFHGYDVELWRETGGIAALQSARVIRMTEEAYRQGAVLSLGDLALLTATSAKSIRETLKPMWTAGMMLPWMGMSRRFAESMQRSWGELAIQRYLSGEDIDEIRKSLFISPSHWCSIYRAAKTEILSGKEGGYVSIWQPAICQERKQMLAEAADRMMRPIPQSLEGLLSELQDWFGMSPAGASLLVDRVQDWLSPSLGGNRGDGQILMNQQASPLPAAIWCRFLWTT